jgi:hypothetical protein
MGNESPITYSLANVENCVKKLGFEIEAERYLFREVVEKQACFVILSTLFLGLLKKNLELSDEQTFENYVRTWRDGEDLLPTLKNQLKWLN